MLDDLTLIPKGPVPVVRSGQACDLLYCAFDETFVSTVRNEIEGRLPLPLDLHSGVVDLAASRILRLLLAEVESGGTSGALYNESLAQAVMIRLLFLSEQPPAQSRRPAKLPNRKLSRVLELIEDRLDADLTLQELAAESGYSRSHFLRAFRESIGMTPHRYLLKRRIECAKRFLGQPNISIADVAYCCGFSSQAHLTLAFRKECGFTPAEYRRQL